MPIINKNDAMELDGHLSRFFEPRAQDRAQRLRELFTQKLDFRTATGRVSLANKSTSVQLPAYAERIASMEGVNVVYVALDIPDTLRVRKAEAAAAARIIANELGEDLLLW